jgi:YmgG-like glycine-zipper protein
MSRKFMAVLLAAVLGAAGVLAFSTDRTTQAGDRYADTSAPVAKTALASNSGSNSSAENEPYLGDFKSGYADGFNAGVTGHSYPDESSMASNSRGYIDGYSQGFTDGQGQQSTLRSELCQRAGVAALSSGPAYYGGSRYAGTRRVASSRTLGDRYDSREYDRGIGTTARRALMIAGGAAAGAGLGGAFGGKKGALIGALVGGGTGTALAFTKKPSRAFNRRVSGKSVLTKTLIGAGAGAAIGALTGGKRGALSGAALGGGGGALWSLLSGRRLRR